MIEFDIDNTQAKVDGKFNLSHLLVGRVKKLRSGVESKVEKVMREKDIVLAIRELESKELEFELVEETKAEKEVTLVEAVLDEDKK